MSFRDMNDFDEWRLELALFSYLHVTVNEVCTGMVWKEIESVKFNDSSP